MLKGLDPLLNADMLFVLRAMGHGDTICIADTNFPATTMGRRIIRLDEADGPRVLRVVLSVMPLDDFVDTPALRIDVVGAPDEVPPVCREYQEVINEVEGQRWTVGKVDRFAFYDLARQCFAVVQTGETRLYGCLILTKGVIRPQG